MTYVQSKERAFACLMLHLLIRSLPKCTTCSCHRQGYNLVVQRWNKPPYWSKVLRGAMHLTQSAAIQFVRLGWRRESTVHRWDMGHHVDMM
jgi:hypothetical protein